MPPHTSKGWSPQHTPLPPLSRSHKLRTLETHSARAVGTRHTHNDTYGEQTMQPRNSIQATTADRYSPQLQGEKVKVRGNQACANLRRQQDKSLNPIALESEAAAVPRCTPAASAGHIGTAAHTHHHHTHHHTAARVQPSCVNATALLHVTKRLDCNDQCSCYCTCIPTLALL